MDYGANDYGAYLKGDPDAPSRIIGAYKDGLILYLNGFVSNIGVAEELTEDTFVKLFVKRPPFYARSSFKTWLYTIARNTARDYLKKQKPDDIPLDDYHESADDAEVLEETYFRQERNRILRNTIKQLKQEYRQILWLIYFEGFSCKESAKIMGKSYHSTKMLVHRARQSLKTKLLEEGFIYEEL